MVFSSLSFLCLFLPAALAAYFLTPAPGGKTKARNATLLFFSLLFYAWGEPKYALLMAVATFLAWAAGLAIAHFLASGKRGKAKAALCLSSSLILFALAYFKYGALFSSALSLLPGVDIPAFRVALPIGISFYTFQSLSYVFDVYQGSCETQKSYATLLCYVSLFPQMIAGPIVRYSDVDSQLSSRKTDWEGFGSGAFLFTCGLSKKVLLANVLGELSALTKASGEGSALCAWLHATAYAFQVYYDFSGYSDMAIGLGKMFGFSFKENFNYPFVSASVTEFWRRWHISLSAWFRDYVYIPLGGNRVSKARHIFNIAVVWALTGFWHGAGWNFALWGLYFAALLIGEKYLYGEALSRLPRFFGHAYCLIAVWLSWPLFDAESLSEAARGFGSLLGVGAPPLWGRESLYYLKSYFAVLALAAAGSTGFPKRLGEKLAQKPVFRALAPAWEAAMLLLCLAFLVDGSYNPFIYFRF
jgi:alginate O-acetyltransferase complex protein AlgI